MAKYVVRMVLTDLTRHLVRYTITYHKYHGHDRNVDLISLLSNDIVLTTYGTVAAEFKRKKSLLHQIKWYRIVLDEGNPPNATSRWLSY